jgi:fructose-1,6-bisphosphatase/inositol monophosphatase family enzyme
MMRVESLLEPIRALHHSLRNAVVGACERQAAEQLAQPAGDEGDTIYAIDRVAEEALLGGLERLTSDGPICVIAEGFPAGKMVVPRDAREQDCRWRLLIDPLDGTRGLMYQKRSAWILTGVAPNRGAATALADIALAVQTEVPLLKQHLADELWAVRGTGMAAYRSNRLSGVSEPLTLRPSGAGTIEHGFATIVRFFPGSGELLGGIDDEISKVLVQAAPRRAASFEDQYASTGGQLYELIAGHDRFVADLRPLVNPTGLCCHPYDLCTALIAGEAGVVVTDARGSSIDAPLDITTDLAWIGYANPGLRTAIEPLLQAALRRRGLIR